MKKEVSMLRMIYWELQTKHSTGLCLSLIARYWVSDHVPHGTNGRTSFVSHAIKHRCGPSFTFFGLQQQVQCSSKSSLARFQRKKGQDNSNFETGRRYESWRREIYSLFESTELHGCRNRSGRVRRSEQKVGPVLPRSDVCQIWEHFETHALWQSLWTLEY